MRAIAVAAEKRLPAFPNVPTIQEAGFRIPNIPVSRGVVAPPGVSKDVVDYWEGVFGRLVKTEAWRKYLLDNQFEDGYLRSADVRKLNDEILAQRREVFSEIGIKMVR